MSCRYSRCTLGGAELLRQRNREPIGFVKVVRNARSTFHRLCDCPGPKNSSEKIRRIRIHDHRVEWNQAMPPADYSIDWRNVSAKSTVTPRSTISPNWECRSSDAGSTLHRALGGVVGAHVRMVGGRMVAGWRERFTSDA
jgi:hypothetical protein